MCGGQLQRGFVLRIGIITMLAGLACGRTREPAVVSPEQVDTEAAVCPTGKPPTTQAQLKACVAELTFDTLELAGDEQRLMINPPCPGSCRYGPRAKIQPAKGSHQYKAGELQEGRIIARLFVLRGEKGYPKLALVPGHMTYWWVRRDPRGKGGISLFISEAMVGNRLVTEQRRLLVDEYPEGTFGRAIAGWVWLDEDETAKGTCGSATCR